MFSDTVPFLPQDAQEVGHVRTLLEEIHQQFIATVKKGRGERLKGGPELFSGLIWTGTRARELGLVDALDAHVTLAPWAIIDGRQPHALLAAVQRGELAGTIIGQPEGLP